MKNQNLDSIRIYGKRSNGDYVGFRIAAKSAGTYSAEPNTEYFYIAPVFVGTGYLDEECVNDMSCSLTELTFFETPTLGEKVDAKLTGDINIVTPAGDLVSQPEFSLEILITLEN